MIHVAIVQRLKVALLMAAKIFISKYISIMWLYGATAAKSGH